MAKLALVIGVSEYLNENQHSLKPLPASVKDAQAIASALQDPDVGGFDKVDSLFNPEPQLMREKIELLFSGREKDDLIVLFFSGHGVKDESGVLHLASSRTTKNQNGRLKVSSAVASSSVHDFMSNCPCQRQVVILDCCYSGAFAAGMTAKDDGSLQLKEQLGGKGRAILTSSTSTQLSIAQEGSELSIYTQFLVEGLNSGAADLDGDGKISIDELHRYAKAKVQESMPTMSPDIILFKEGYQIHVAEALTELKKYRKDIEFFGRSGELSATGRKTLDAHIKALKLSSEEALEIETEILKPLQEYRENLQHYEDVLSDPNLNEFKLKELKQFQIRFKLRDEDLASVEAKVRARQPAAQNKQAEREPEVTPPPIVQTSTLASDIDSAKTLSKPVPFRVRHQVFITIVSCFIVFIAFILYASTWDQEKTPPANPLVTDSAAKNDAQKEDQTKTENVKATASNNPGDYLREGDTKTASGNFIGAISDYDAAIKLDASNPQSFGKRAYAKFMGKLSPQQAIDDYTQAIRLSPENAQAYIGRGDVRSSMQKFPEAIEDYTQAISRDLNSWYAYNARGFAKGSLGKHKDAIEDFTSALSLNPKNSYALNQRGAANTSLDKCDAAIRDYDKVISLNSKNIDASIAFNGRGWCREQMRKYPQAIEDYQQALRIDSRHPFASANLKRVEWKQANKQ